MTPLDIRERFIRIYRGEVTKRLVDIDDDLLARVREILGTPTMKDTVNGALEEVVMFARQRARQCCQRGFRDGVATKCRTERLDLRVDGHGAMIARRGCRRSESESGGGVVGEQRPGADVAAEDLH